MRTVVKTALIAATLALPFWGAFGFLFAGALALTIGSASLIIRS